MRRTTPAAVAAVALALLPLAGLTGLSSTAAAAPAAPTAPASVAAINAAAYVPPPIAWGRCSSSFLREVHGQCGRLTVPLDPADPTGATIQVGVSRVIHTHGPVRGVVFTNAGGPGGEGEFLAGLASYVPDGVGTTYDWYGMDPRGVGQSRPHLSCNPGFDTGDRPLYRPKDRRTLSYWLRTTERYASDCAGSSTTALLQHEHTTDVVADYEALREAVGADQVTFHGASYGSYVGEVYATLHPDRVKAMVLDGVIDPGHVWYQANLAQNVAFQKTFDRFLAWVAKYPRAFGLGATPKAVHRTYARVHRQLAHHALGKLGPDELDDALLPAGYYTYGWIDTAQALAALVHRHDARPLTRMWRQQDPRSDTGYAAYLATECTDAPWPTDWATWQADATRQNKKAPFFTWANTWFNAPCRTWPVAPSRPVAVSGAAYTGPVLMTVQSLDAATPYAGALAARALFPTARVVVGVGGTTHAASLSGVACTDDAIAAVLRDGSLPARKSGDHADKKCPPLAPPVPGTSSDAPADTAPALPAWIAARMGAVWP